MPSAASRTSQFDDAFERFNRAIDGGGDIEAAIKRIVAYLKDPVSPKTFQFCTVFWLHAINEKNKVRNTKLETLERRLADLEGHKHADPNAIGRIEWLEERVKTLEERPSMVYRGVFDMTRTYERGDTVSYSGGCWFANERSCGVRPNEESRTGKRVWTLAVMRGKEGRCRHRDTDPPFGAAGRSEVQR